MILTFAVILITIIFLLRPLQKNVFFLIYFALMMGAAYLSEYIGYRFVFLSKQSVLMFLLWHIVLINLMTIIAYGTDKYAAKKGAWRVPEKQLHLMELLGGSPGAYLAQRLFKHKTKKKSFQLFFVFVLALQAIIIYYVMKMLQVF